MAATNLPVEITVPLDFDQYLSTYTGPGPDGEYGREPATFEDIIAERVAHIVATKVIGDRDRYTSIRKSVEDRITELVAEKVDARIEAALAEPRQPTDGYGQPKGEPTTLTEIILTRVDQHLNSAFKDQYNPRTNNKTRLQVLADEAIDRKWDDEVRKSIEQAQAEVRAQVTARAAEILSESVKAVIR